MQRITLFICLFLVSSLNAGNQKEKINIDGVHIVKQNTTYHSIYLTTTDGAYMGEIQLSIPTTNYETDCVGHINLLKVCENFRHRSVGEQLFKKAISWLKKNGCTKIRWTAYPLDVVDKDRQQAMERLVAWYKTLGGKVTSKINISGGTDMHYVIPTYC